jgi:hypothetical protein
MSAFGDGVLVRCAPQPVHSGFEALTRAGFTYQGTTRFPGLLCRIDGEPASDPCHGAPPANAYWAYWHASRGGSWTYSTSGAGSRVPPPGSVEGWAFGDDAEPGVDPPARPPTTTTTRPTTPTTSGAGSGGGAPPPAGGTASGVVTTSTTEPGASTSTTEAEGGSTSTRDDGTSGTGDDGPETAQAAGAGSPGGGDGPGGGSPVGAIVGLTVAVVLAVAGIRAARRRRGVGEEPA